MEVAPFFVDFHHCLSIFTIFYLFSRFTHFCRDLHFVAIYALFPQIFSAKIAYSATSHVFCMYAFLVPSLSANTTIHRNMFCIFLSSRDQIFCFPKLMTRSHGLGSALTNKSFNLYYLRFLAVKRQFQHQHASQNISLIPSPVLLLMSL